MGDFLRSLLIYLIGGVTFVPATLLALFVYTWYTSVPISPDERRHGEAALLDDADDGRNIHGGQEIHDAKLLKSVEKEHTGYFAVCREWIPGGVSGKPPEKTSPAGEVIAEESPSVYQSMYRSLFDRRHGPTMETPKVNGRALKKANNIFFIVLRHGHLMLYDDSEQVEVRYVISLAQHDVTIYGGDTTPLEGELFIKRNAIRLSRRASLADSVEALTKPFFIYSENCSDKEDFYFALLQNKERHGHEEHPPPLVQRFETKHIISLVQKLHSSEEHLQTRWFNALLGRLFLGIYKTQDIENFVRMKITKKISRVKIPGFLSGISIRKIDLGESAPFFTNPRLKDLNVDGECCVEADVKYDGKFRIEIAATARLDLGSRFKAREVNLVLAITLKKLDGHFLVRFKPPPSNRLWFTFDKMPQMDLQIEPIVSSRQITYNIILRAIESRIREVFAETLVVPYWDDIPFLKTTDQYYRGGIWVNEKRDFQAPTETIIPDGDDSEASDTVASVPVDEKLQNTPVVTEAQKPVSSRKSNKSNQSLNADTDTALSSGVQRVDEFPKGMKSSRFPSAAGPITSTNHIHSDPAKKEPRRKASKDAASVMSELSNRSHPPSPGVIPPTPTEDGSGFGLVHADHSNTGTPSVNSDSKSDLSTVSLENDIRRRATSSTDSHWKSTGHDDAASATRLQSLARTLTPSEKKQQALGSAALAAKNWGWKTLSKAKAGNSPTMTERLGSPDNPIGRGQPLPPPGQPLPPPEKRRSASFQMPARKAVPPKRPENLSNTGRELLDTSAVTSPPASAPPLQTKASKLQASTATDDMLVVAAPTDSRPSTPADDKDEDYGEFMDNFIPDEDDVPDGTYTTSTTLDTIDMVINAQSPLTSEKAAKTADEAVAGLLKTVARPKLARDHSPAISDPEVLGTMSHDEDSGLDSWKVAEEEEARSKSVWMDEQEIP